MERQGFKMGMVLGKWEWFGECCYLVTPQHGQAIRLIMGAI